LTVHPSRTGGEKANNTQESATLHALSFGVLARRINQYDLPDP
jgi:hypothetical protein